MRAWATHQSARHSSGDARFSGMANSPAMESALPAVAKPGGRQYLRVR